MPTGNSVAVNRPEDSVVAWRTTSPVASFFTITLAPAMTASDASCTTPLMAPVAPPWGHIDPARNAMQATVTTSLFVKVKAASLHKVVVFRLEKQLCQQGGTTLQSLIEEVCSQTKR